MRRLTSPVNILFDISNEPMNNIGDVAMTSAAIHRLTEITPNATIQIISTEPKRCAALFPNAATISGNPHKALTATGRLLGRLARFAPQVESSLRIRWPKTMARVAAMRSRRRDVNGDDLGPYLHAIQNADLVVMPGGGWVTDAFAESTRPVLETLALAQRFGKPTALLGHGFGPATRSDLLRLTGHVARRAALITVRERKCSVPLLRSLKVPESKIEVTGDDAIELAYAARPDSLGTSVGINLRRASYSSVGSTEATRLRQALQRLQETFAVPFLSIPIAFYKGPGHDSDLESINDLLGNGAGSAADDGDAIGLHEVIRRVGECRIVITGSYHAAVFALSQGVSAIGLASSPYYVSKFEGLADMFQAGCETVRLNRSDLDEALLESFARLWEAAEHQRPRLLQAARDQIEFGRRAYRKLCSMLPLRGAL